MDNIDNITKKIISDAENEKERILEEASQKAESITSDFDERVAIEEKHYSDDNESLYKQIKNGYEIEADLASRNKVLAAKQNMIDKAFKKAVDEVINLPNEKKTKLLTELAYKSVSSGEEELIFSKELKEELGKKIVDDVNAMLKSDGKKAELTLSNDTMDKGYGFIVKDKDTDINCSLEQLVWALRDTLDNSLAEILFKDES